MPMDFDHLVLMMRDQLTDRAPALQQDGFHLTDVSVHNLGSMNRLITLDSSYIELLGWPAGQAPARPEIAGQPLGLDALVFRPRNADETYKALRRSGFDVNPVQRLERPRDPDGAQMVRFDTVRFATQPVPGLRIYYCEHLTPEYVWDPAAMRHGNGAVSIDSIVIKAADAHQVAATLAALLNGQVQPQDGGEYRIELPNLQLLIEPDGTLTEARIAQAMLKYRDGTVRAFHPPL